MSKQGVFTHRAASQHAYGIVAATTLDGAATATIKVGAKAARTASWADHTWDSTSIRIASSVAATS